MTREIAKAANAIKAATSLRELLDALVEFESLFDGLEADIENEYRAAGIDIRELPKFGGSAPASTAEVRSWDEDCLLVGTGRAAEWNIVERRETVL